MGNAKQSDDKLRRQALVTDMLTKCYSPGKIAAEVMKEFSCCRATAWNDIKHVRTKVLPSWYQWDDKRTMAIEVAVKLERIACIAITKGNLHVALQALKQYAELAGLNSAQQIAGRKDTLRGELMALRAQLVERAKEDSDQPGPRQISLEAFNQVRSMYALSTMTRDEFGEYRRLIGKRSGEEVDQ